MARLERPKGYSRELWKKLQNQIRNIKRFVTQKTKSGARVKNVPDVEDVYTPKGRKKIREWSAKKQWESTEYVKRETGEVVTGKEAKKAWSEARKEERKREEPPASENIPENDIVEDIYDLLWQIPDERYVYSRSNRAYMRINTGGMRSVLIDMLKDIADNTEYLQNNQTGITEGVQEIKWASKQEDINHAYSGLLVIFNGGKSLSLEQWDDVQDTALNY